MLKQQSLLSPVVRSDNEKSWIASPIKKGAATGGHRAEARKDRTLRTQALVTQDGVDTPATVIANRSDSRRISMPSIDHDLTHFESRNQLLTVPETATTSKVDLSSA